MNVNVVELAFVCLKKTKSGVKGHERARPAGVWNGRVRLKVE